MAQLSGYAGQHPMCGRYSHEVHNHDIWMTVDVNLNSAEWTFTCIKIADELDLVFGSLRDEDEMYFDEDTTTW